MPDPTESTTPAAAAQFAHLLGRAPKVETVDSEAAAAAAAAEAAQLDASARAAKAEGEDDKDDDKKRDDESDEDFDKRKKAKAKAKAEKDDEDKEKAAKAKSKAKADDDDEKDAEMHGSGGAAQARSRERERCAAIFSHPAAGVRPDMAARLAFTTRMSRNEAISILAESASVAPAAEASATTLGPARPRLSERMSGEAAEVRDAVPEGSGAPKLTPAQFAAVSAAKARGEAIPTFS